MRFVLDEGQKQSKAGSETEHLAGNACQLANLRRNSCSSIRYLKALRPSMKTTGTSSVKRRRSVSSASTSTSRQ